MNILFFTVSAGEGHNKVAKTISNYIDNNFPHNNTKIIDTFHYVNSNLHKIIIETYMKSIKYIPTLYGYVYKKTEENDSSIMDMGDFLNTILLSRKLKKLLKDFNPDVIVCTHPFPSEALSALKKKGQISVPIVNVLTDYTIHPSWINSEVDYFVFPCDSFEYELDYWHIPRQKARFFGIPIDNKFHMNEDREKLCNKLSIKNSFTTLLMGGGLGLGNIKETLDYVLKYNNDMQIIAITGRNESLYKYLTNIDNPNLIVYGFVDNINELMSISDFIITKPGGITVTEALSKELPIIVSYSLPGQEERNTEFILNNSIGMIANSPNSLISCINTLKDNTHKYYELKDNMNKMKKTDSVKNICEFILSLREAKKHG
ncbi:MAG: hypothetical protein N4A57_15535 [Anaeromicrobium sp.]|uniref:MGDG synthase family glycosyltransferase n=1 Tax=Anaeromicrobium sp. TaxID=1929132 RepID=UPI0025DA7B69|nr:glycosyltransferase [Anaeromicrobium sp.]MCT4595660.1 hypothetical protein [Anaeromicrobium sp.]